MSQEVKVAVCQSSNIGLEKKIAVDKGFQVLNHDREQLKTEQTKKRNFPYRSKDGSSGNQHTRNNKDSSVANRSTTLRQKKLWTPNEITMIKKYFIFS